MARTPATQKAPADVGAPVPAYVVAAPLRHDGRDYAPGDPVPDGLTESQIKRLEAQGVISISTVMP